MKKINSALHNPNVQGGIVLTVLFLGVVVAFVLSLGK